MSGQLIGDLLSVGGKVQEERDRLAAELQESERLRQEAFATCEAMRLERDEWKAAAEYQQQQATQLRLQVEALESTLAAVLEANKTLLQQRDELQAQLEAAIVTPAICPQQSDQIDGLPNGSWTDYGRIGGYTPEDRAFHESRTKPQQQQPDGTAERLEAVRRMIGEIWGWYACVECLGEQSAETWEQAGALLGHLQREAG